MRPGDRPADPHQRVWMRIDGKLPGRPAAARLRADVRLRPDPARLGAVGARRGLGAGRGDRREPGPRAVVPPAVPGRRVVPLRLLEPVGRRAPAGWPPAGCSPSTAGTSPAPCRRGCCAASADRPGSSTRLGIMAGAARARRYPCGMRLSARVDYALRAAVELAAASRPPTRPSPDVDRRTDRPGAGDPAEVPGEHPAAAASGRASCTPSAGPEGGYWLARPADEISLARGDPGDRRAAGAHPRPASGGSRLPRRGRALQEVWIALRASEREILELVTLADVATGQPARPGRRAGRRPARLDVTGSTLRSVAFSPADRHGAERRLTPPRRPSHMIGD